MRNYQRADDDVLRASMTERSKEAPYGWMTLGVCPEPRTPLQAFRYHVGHGLVMGYPLHRVLVWSWRHRRSFDD